MLLPPGNWPEFSNPFEIEIGDHSSSLASDDKFILELNEQPGDAQLSNQVRKYVIYFPGIVSASFNADGLKFMLPSEF